MRLALTTALNFPNVYHCCGRLPAKHNVLCAVHPALSIRNPISEIRNRTIDTPLI
ncbi:hypothetical protein D1AOALGA4SA_9217 [Olavius algarvensis Delta 1 endosymbiont]|nr:hypothetical protein D1AOALGA4SA_9217 [Olavius algarvensis Delta 1 endosymbiont]